MNKKTYDRIKFISIVIISIFLFLLIKLYTKTQIYEETYCDNVNDFCMYETFDLDLDKRIKDACIRIYKSDLGVYKKYNYKSSRFIGTTDILQNEPILIDYYKFLIPFFQDITNLNITNTPLTHNLSCGILIYDKEGDFIDWHYDMNTYNGRFFTVLIPIYNNSKCCTFQYRQQDQIYNINLQENQGIIIEGEKLYHRCTKLCDNELRIVFTFTYATDPSTNLYKQALHTIKTFAFL